MPGPGGGYSPGKRGTNPGVGTNPNMPAKEPAVQQDLNQTERGKRGAHPSDFSGNSLNAPNELRRNIGLTGTTDFDPNVELEIDEFRNLEPRRSHK